MKRFLLIKYMLHGSRYGKNDDSFSPEHPVVMLDMIEKKHLLELKNGKCDAIIDTQKNTYFDPGKNQWIPIKEIS